MMVACQTGRLVRTPPTLMGQLSCQCRVRYSCDG